MDGSITPSDDNNSGSSYWATKRDDPLELQLDLWLLVGSGQHQGDGAYYGYLCMDRACGFVLHDMYQPNYNSYGHRSKRIHYHGYCK
jgi:hypothetical protein